MEGCNGKEVGLMIREEISGELGGGQGGGGG